MKVVENVAELEQVLAELFAKHGIRFGKSFRHAEEDSQEGKLYEALDTAGVNIRADRYP